jgi:hypothetical protein
MIPGKTELVPELLCFLFVNVAAAGKVGIGMEGSVFLVRMTMHLIGDSPAADYTNFKHC